MHAKIEDLKSISRRLAASVCLLYTSKRLIQAMTDVKESINSYTMTRESIVLGAASLADEEYFQEKKQMVVATRERTKEELRRRGFEVLDSSANFLFARCV